MIRLVAESGVLDADDLGARTTTRVSQADFGRFILSVDHPAFDDLPRSTPDPEGDAGDTTNTRRKQLKPPTGHGSFVRSFVRSFVFLRWCLVLCCV